MRRDAAEANSRPAARASDATSRGDGGTRAAASRCCRPRRAPAQRRQRPPYRHCSHFHYPSGFDEPQAWLLLDDSGHSTLLCREKNAEREIWDGHRLGPEAAPAMLGVDEAHPVEALDRVAVDKLAGAAAGGLPFGVHDGLVARVDGWLAALRGRSHLGIRSP